jgi:hypothetical protein
VDDLSLIAEEVVNSVNNRLKGIDTVNGNKGLVRYY